MAFLYIRTSELQYNNNVVKYGYTTNLIKRLQSAQTEHSTKCKYLVIYEIEEKINYDLSVEYDKIISTFGHDIEMIKNYEMYHNVKLPLLKNLSNYLIDDSGGIEFVEKFGIDHFTSFIENELTYFNLNIVKIYTQKEIDIINHQTLKKIEKDKENYRNKFQKYKSIWKLRKYQEDSIKEGLLRLAKVNKFYLNLATGGGKSYIIYEILSKLQPVNIIILTPRIEISKQNISQKYLKLLKYNYHVYNYSDKIKKIKNQIKNIIVGCFQSAEKIYNLVKKNKLNNIVVWFDESHYSIENWINEKREDEFINFFLQDTNIIQKRIFSSASPDKNVVQSNNDIFGHLYCPISVKNLIEEKYLCPIVPHVYLTEKNNVSILKFVLDNFKSLNKNWGFSFHNLQENAYKMFKMHYELYRKEDTDIKPFLLVGDYKISDDIKLFFKNVNEFENNRYSIGYVVRKFSIGYDFHGIDYIVFSDPKYSAKDIIQSIGRGTRSDKNGINGKNKEKELCVMLPTYINHELNTDYKRIVEVLRHLLYNFEISMDKIIMMNSCNISDKKINKNETYVDYDGINEMQSKILDLLKLDDKWKLCDFIKLLKDNNIFSDKEYYKFINLKKNLNLPKLPHKYFGDKFGWSLLIDEQFYKKLECIQKINYIMNKYEDEYNDLEFDEEKIIFLHKKDKKIPNKPYWKFYKKSKRSEFNF
ncbi:MAG: hypothetical protein CMF62_02990 [Magnetococcales bacterium]|nr:hypothetical protein [Magnetococcales bacterium]|tara:strand:- start:11290 stop:13389 length:2100 start_codon:yes stop_codon:yes gene_type:complete